MRVPVSQGRTKTGTGTRTDSPCPCPSTAGVPARGEPRPARPPGEKTRRQKAGRGGALPFRRFIARDHIRLLYFLGAIVIILIPLVAIGAVLSAAGTGGTDVSGQLFTNTTALMETPSASPLFWIGFLIIGSLVWRVFCELVAAVFRIYDIVSEGGDALPEGGATGYGGEWAEGMVRCTRCGKVVPTDQLRECEHCGVQGCSSCIRMMGLLNKTMTCRECFENK